MAAPPAFLRRHVALDGDGGLTSSQNPNSQSSGCPRNSTRGAAALSYPAIGCHFSAAINASHSRSASARSITVVSQVSRPSDRSGPRSPSTSRRLPHRRPWPARQSAQPRTEGSSRRAGRSRCWRKPTAPNHSVSDEARVQKSRRRSSISRSAAIKVAQ